MSLPDGEDRYLVGKSVGLDEVQIEEISMLPTGVGVVFQNNWSTAVLCKVPYQTELLLTKYGSCVADVEDEWIFDLINLFKSNSYSENLAEQLKLLLMKCNVRSCLKYEILTSNIFDLDGIKKVCSLILLDVIGPNLAKEIRHLNDIHEYTIALKSMIKRKIGLSDIKDEYLLVLADMYVKGICLKDKDLKTYQLWKGVNYGC